MARSFGFSRAWRPLVACFAVWALLGGTSNGAYAEESSTSLKINTPVGQTDPQTDTPIDVGAAPVVDSRADAGAAAAPNADAKSEPKIEPKASSEPKTEPKPDMAAAPVQKTPIDTRAAQAPPVQKEPPPPGNDTPAVQNETAKNSAPSTVQASTPSAQNTAPPEWHRAQMRLSGSMCVACLKELEGKLKKIAGVDRVRIQRPTVNYSSSYSPDVTAWADGVVLYDLNQLPLDSLREAIRENGYHSYSIRDKMLEHDPDDHDLRF